MDYWIVFNMVAYSIFIIGGIIIFKRMKEFMIIPLFFIVVGVMLNSIGHILLSVYVGGYFSGLYTSIIYLFFVPLVVNRILKENNPLKMFRNLRYMMRQTAVRLVIKFQ